MTKLSQLSRSIEGKVALVTGAASGMGRATAFVLADEGAHVAVTDINDVGPVVEAITTAGGSAHGWRLDVGDADAITFRPLRGVERQAAIQGGEVDVISRLTTRTLSRDTTWGVIYGPTTYFDGQGIGTRAEYGISTIDELDGGAICVQHGTTTELNITDATSARGLDIAILGYPDLTSTFHAYLEGRCEAWTANRASIIGLHTTSSDPAAHVILDILLSKEPGTPLSPQSDPQFAEVIAWTIFGLFSAEEHGITGTNVDDFLSSDDAAIQRLLGQGGTASGSYLGLANDFMVEVIRQVGNYGEIFARNLSVPPFNLERGINALWTDGGLMYAPPFR